MVERPRTAKVAGQPADLLDAAVEALLTRARREVDEGLLPSVQIALAHEGQIVLQQSYGAADNQSLCCIFSATKAVTSAAAWLLIQDGRLSLDERVGERIPEFASHGKDAVQVHHLLTHSAGFPHAPFRPLDWEDTAVRRERYRQWRLDWPPGSRFEYHPSSSMWVVAELIERASGLSFHEFVRTRVIEPLGLSNFFVGLPAAQQHRVLPLQHVGDALTSTDYERLGIPEPPATEVTEEAILNFNKPEVQAVGVPGGGGFANAADLALFYQGLLHGGRHGGERIWQPTMLERARSVRYPEHRDPLFGTLANRGLGIVIAGDDQRSYRGFGKTNSALAFGHNGAGGQLAWADPATGLSLAYLTPGHDRNAIRQARRGVALGSLAAVCVAA